MALKTLAVTALLSVLVSRGAADVSVSQTELGIVEQFSAATAAYDSVHQRIAWRIPAQVCSDPEKIIARSNALADAIRRVRPDARSGDLFTTDVAALFRERIRSALRSRQLTASELLAATAGEAPPARAELTVNGQFDWRYGALMPAVIIEALPRLPDSLQYRFVRSDLVLVDVDANLIVDVLPGALEVE